MDDILLRTIKSTEMTKEEFQTIRELQNKVFESKHSWQGVGFFVPTGDDGYYFVMQSGDEIIAVCSIDCSEEMPGYLEICMLFVSPEHQHKMLGGTLLTFALSRRRDNEHKIAIVRIPEKDGGARRFLERFGFKEIKRSDTIITYATFI